MYNAKWTPIMRRQGARSKRTDELKRLKLQYEQMQGFDERFVEQKLRKVRLARLFNKINIIKESSVPNKQRVPPKTEQELRVEQMQKARELGMHYSKMNKVQEPDWARRFDGSVRKPESPLVKEKLEKKRLTAMRVDYGNEISRYNMMRNLVAKKPARVKRTQQQIELDQAEEDKKRKLRHRINYGNLTSNINMLKVIERKKRELDMGTERSEGLCDEDEEKSTSKGLEKQPDMYRLGMLQKLLHSNLFEGDIVAMQHEENNSGTYPDSTVSERQAHKNPSSQSTTETDRTPPLPFDDWLQKTSNEERVMSCEESFDTANDETENVRTGSTLYPEEDLPPPPPEMLTELSAINASNISRDSQQPPTESDGITDLRKKIVNYSQKFMGNYNKA